MYASSPALLQEGTDWSHCEATVPSSTSAEAYTGEVIGDGTLPTPGAPTLGGSKLHGRATSKIVSAVLGCQTAGNQQLSSKTDNTHGGTPSCLTNPFLTSSPGSVSSRTQLTNQTYSQAMVRFWVDSSSGPLVIHEMHGTQPTIKARNCRGRTQCV